MKLTVQLISYVCLLTLNSCEEKKPEEKTPEASALSEELRKKDTPILPIKKGDTWEYKVRIEIPAGITSQGASAVDVEQEKTRTYLGKIKVGEEYPEVDAFEVTMPGEPVERELVEIYDDRIMMRGSLTPNPEGLNPKPIWLESPVVFVFAGMRPGLQVTKLSIQEGVRNRGIQVVAREAVTVAAGEFPTIRLLMTGNDGKFELRKTTWFAPKVGIVKEENARYADGKLIYRETTELVKTNVTER